VLLRAELALPASVRGPVYRASVVIYVPSDSKVAEGFAAFDTVIL
jgi:hypothetical protein